MSTAQEQQLLNLLEFSDHQRAVLQLIMHREYGKVLQAARMIDPAEDNKTARRIGRWLAFWAK